MRSIPPARFGVAPEEHPLAVHAAAVPQAGVLVRAADIDRDLDLGEPRHDPLGPRKHPLLELEPRARVGVRGRPLGEVGVEVGRREAKRVGFRRRGHCRGAVTFCARFTARLRASFRGPTGRASVSSPPECVNRASGRPRRRGVRLGRPAALLQFAQAPDGPAILGAPVARRAVAILTGVPTMSEPASVRLPPPSRHAAPPTSTPPGAHLGDARSALPAHPTRPKRSSCATTNLFVSLSRSGSPLSRGASRRHARHLAACRHQVIRHKEAYPPPRKESLMSDTTANHPARVRQCLRLQRRPGAAVLFRSGGSPRRRSGARDAGQASSGLARGGGAGGRGASRDSRSGGMRGPKRARRRAASFAPRPPRDGESERVPEPYVRGSSSGFGGSNPPNANGFRGAPSRGGPNDRFAPRPAFGDRERGSSADRGPRTPRSLQHQEVRPRASMAARGAGSSAPRTASGARGAFDRGAPRTRDGAAPSWGTRPNERPNEGGQGGPHPPRAARGIDRGPTAPREAKPNERPPGTRPERPRYDITCGECGTQAQVPYKPHEGRQVFCHPCYRAPKGPAPTEATASDDTDAGIVE